MEAACGVDGTFCQVAAESSKTALSETARAAALLLKGLTQDERQAVVAEALALDGVDHLASGVAEAASNGSLAAVADDDAGTASLLGPCMTAAFICVAVSIMAYLFLVVLNERQRYHARHADKRANFKTYLRYRFGYWYTWTPGSAGIVLLVMSLCLLLAGGALLRVVMDQPISESLWAAWIWIAAPDGGGSQETPLGRMIGMFVSVGGMLIFALLMSVVSSTFEDTLHNLRAGAAPVIEGDHCVIIGDGPMLATIVAELCSAAESRGGSVIAILSPRSKLEVEDYLRETEIDFRNSTVVVRSGLGHKVEDLQKVSVESARRVVVLGKTGVSREDCDAMTLNVLLTMKNNGWPASGSTVVQCELVRNQRLFGELAGEASQVLTTNDFVGELMVQCSRQRGLASIVSSLFSFEDDEFYIKRVENTGGRFFREAIFATPNVVLIGLASKARGVELLPPMDRVIQEDEELVMLAQDASFIPTAISESLLQNSEGARLQARWRRERMDWSERGSPEIIEKAALGLDATVTETVVILGWNETIGAILVELDNSLSLCHRA
eukprot:TRINITY_DN14868_c0_g2_i1.p1 TRINITY_DN14868_c0_g2~~TRINITY_DN14868_c0_g2_i1.p1  ORF type:complete len:572 (+),score=142.27 TRINITY_DN14868_c0_g2_i1:53-1717(+)